MGRFSKLELGQSAPAPAPPREAKRPAEPSLIARPEESVDAHGCLRRGAELLFEGESDEALRLFGRALHLDSTLHEAWVGQIDRPSRQTAIAGS